MGYLIDAWKSAQRTFDMNLKQIVNIAGDESLEKTEAVNELREFYSMIDLQTMERLLKECYSKDRKIYFDARGFVFQDLVNEMGRRLGYDVEWGLYRGRKNEIGYDGLWTRKDGSSIIMEAKTTGDYAFDPNTVSDYRKELIYVGKITEKQSSILVVYGRDEKGSLRNAVKGSDNSHNIRLISANALFQLVKIVVNSRSYVPAEQTYNLLKPKDYFVLDNLVELVFPETDPEIQAVEDSHEKPKKNSRKQENSIKQKPSGNIPPLPDVTLSVGMFVRTAMENLSAAGYIFTDEQMEQMCSPEWMHDTIGFARRLPFFKIYDENEEKGYCINGQNRFYAKPLTYGKYTVYLTKELFQNDKEQFIAWYNTLK